LPAPGLRFEPPSPRWYAAWRDHYERYAGALGDPYDDAVAATVWAWLLAGTHRVEGVLAIDGDELAGFAHFRPFPRTLHANEACFLDDLWVAEPHRGTGLGRALIEHVCTIARARGWTQVRWVTERRNEKARRLYDAIAENSGIVTYRIRVIEE
jgi:GNAT superfamily N-acetyltransferase